MVTDNDPIPNEAFREAMGRVYRPPKGVPQEVDDAILAMASERIAAPARTMAFARSRRRLVRLAAAAALLLAALGTWYGFQAAQEPERTKATVVREDLDGSGRLDVLDALYLARRVTDGEVARAEWDFNLDGHIDLADADHLADLAVRLPG